MGEGVLGVGAGVLFRLCCSGVFTGVQVKVQVFWIGSGCSGMSAGVLVKVQVFCSGCGCFE